MHSITVYHLREGWTNNVKIKRQGRCVFSFHAYLIHVVSLELSRLKKSSAAIKRLLSSLFGHDLFNLNLQAVRVGGLTQSFKYALKRHYCYDKSIYYICQNFLS